MLAGLRGGDSSGSAMLQPVLPCEHTTNVMCGWQLYNGGFRKAVRMLRFQLILLRIFYEFGSTQLTLEKGMLRPDEREREATAPGCSKKRNKNKTNKKKTERQVANNWCCDRN